MFIEIEGIEAAGKSTQCSLLQDWFRSQGQECAMVKELSSTKFSQGVREILLGDVLKDRKAEMFLFLSCKSQVFSQIILPHLVQGRHVVCDRGSGSFVSYNNTVLGLDRDMLVDLLNLATSGFQPDLTILLDVEVGLARQRINARPEKTRFDMMGDSHLTKQRNKLIELAHIFPSWTVIDGALPIDEVHKKIVEVVKGISGET